MLKKNSGKTSPCSSPVLTVNSSVGTSDGGIHVDIKWSKDSEEFSSDAGLNLIVPLFFSIIRIKRFFVIKVPSMFGFFKYALGYKLYRGYFQMSNNCFYCNRCFPKKNEFERIQMIRNRNLDSVWSQWCNFIHFSIGEFLHF